MKKSILFLTVAALAAASCSQSSPDITTFGLKGDVKEVWFTDELVAASELDGEELGEGTVSENELQMRFDEQGRVLRDVYGNTYEYDADGNFVRGQLRGTELERDAKGRILRYDSTNFEDWDSEDFDIVAFFAVTFTYDGKGRPQAADTNGWEWNTTYSYAYNGGNVYPASATYEGGAEGWIEEGTITYEYVSFDEKGNWTERFVSTVNKSWEEPWEEGMEPEIDTVTYKHRECRTITYWSDGK